MTSFAFTIPGQAQPKGRPRFTRTGIAYTPATTRRYEEVVRTFFRFTAGPGFKPMAGPLQIQIDELREPPAGWPKSRRSAALAGEVLPDVRPDTDNAAKAILDALNGIAWGDDAQICDLRARKRYAEHAAVHVHIQHMPGVVGAKR